ncbi:MAG TPA: hypothetical protein VFU31_22640 [Candidatus Binatia bacterium]|nr:hypothetical protein [Candidatus Binatia bacterium]
MQSAAKKTIIRIELWHGFLLAVLLILLAPTRFIDSKSALLGGLFIGVNFWLLGYGVAWVLAPLGSKGRVKAGVGLLVLKSVVFLGLLTTLFFRFPIEALSFSLGVSTLIIAILLEALRHGMALRT